MKRNSISFYAGIFAVSGYLLFTLLAYIRYPLDYAPLTRWLSDLGNTDLSPKGAIWYNIGIITTALWLIIFFIGLSIWKMVDHHVQIIMVYLTQAFGISGSLCMLMSGIFPINQYKIHAFWSTSLYILISTAFIFSVAMLRNYRWVPKWILILGGMNALVVIFTSIFQTAYVLEWITVLLFLSYVSLLGVLTRKRISAM
jgi:hypothetical protein